MEPKVDLYLSKAPQWQPEMERLRTIALECGLTETLKWGVPCYTYQNSNILLISGFKAYCALSFFKGALLKDEHHLLAKPGENTQSARLIRFTQMQEISEKEAILKAYITEAIEVEKAGIKVSFSDNIALNFPEELQKKFDENTDFKKAFEALTPGRQRAYNLYFSQPKQAKTRESRIEKYMQQILDGKGIHDCTCGLSQKMPTCDGSHKYNRTDCNGSIL